MDLKTIIAFYDKMIALCKDVYNQKAQLSFGVEQRLKWIAPKECPPELINFVQEALDNSSEDVTRNVDAIARDAIKAFAVNLHLEKKQIEQQEFEMSLKNEQDQEQQAQDAGQEEAGKGKAKKEKTVKNGFPTWLLVVTGVGSLAIGSATGFLLHDSIVGATAKKPSGGKASFAGIGGMSF
jgi:hypothetical protein